MSDIIKRAQSKLSSFHAENRTVDVVLATETPVRRRLWDGGVFDEILLVNRSAIDTSRLDSMPLLDSHDAYSGMGARLGSVVPNSLRFDGKTAIVTVKISRNEMGQNLFRDLEDGHTLGVSVGYRIDTQEKTEAPAGGTATVRATRWTPMEISVVSIPADPNASTRSENLEEYRMSQNETEIVERSSEEDTITRRMTVREARGLAAELTQRIKFDADLAAEVQSRIKPRMTEFQVRELISEVKIENEEKAPTFPVTEMELKFGLYTQQRQQDELKARCDALVARMTGQKPEGNARDFMQCSLLDHARGIMESKGVNTRNMTREELVYGGSRRSLTLAHTVSDFPYLLQSAGERVLMNAYELAQSPLKTVISRKSTAVDFRAKTKLKLSDLGLLEKITETGEITATTRSETAESYRIESFGRIFAMSFAAIVNDDLGAFSDWATAAGRVAALTENKILLDLLLANNGNGPTMNEDSRSLFHANHQNLASTGAYLDQVTLAAALLSFRKQTAPGTNYRIGAAPRYLLVGPELEIAAEKLLTSTVNATTWDNTIAASIKAITPIVEPNLDGTSFYLFADPAQLPVLEWSYLSGYEGPQLMTRDGFERLGTEFRAVLHFGAGAIDYRGAYRNPGQTP